MGDKAGDDGEEGSTGAGQQVAATPQDSGAPSAGAAGIVDYNPGGGCDFGSIGGGDDTAASADAAPKQGGGWGLLQNAWSVTQKLAKDVGVNDAFKDVSKAVNKIKANQMAGGLPLIESIPEVDAAINYIRDSRDKYTQLLGFLNDMSAENVKVALTLRRAGAAFIRCASISERVAREMATNPKQEAFYKEMPTYQADLNEALLVTSGALMYQADRAQAMYTTNANVGASLHQFEQGSYSNKYYTASERQLEPTALYDTVKEIQSLLQNEIREAERARRKYKDLRLDMSMRALEHAELTKHNRATPQATQAFEERMAADQSQLDQFREDLLSAQRLLVEAKTRISSAVKGVLAAEKEMHAAAIKSYAGTLNALPNAPHAQVQG